MTTDWEHQLILGRFQVDVRMPGDEESYRAWDNQTKQVVILHLLPETEDQMRREFETGIRDLERAIHPGILPYFGLFELSGQRFWVDAYLEGPTLRLVLNGLPLPLGEALTYIKSVAAALEALHQAGWVHGRLHPESVRLGRDGSIHLTELFAVHRITDDFDRAADVAALARLLYEMLAGRLPFERPLPDLREMNLDVPEFLARTLPRALGENPESRIISPNEFFLMACLACHIEADKLPSRFVGGGAGSPSAALIEGWATLPPMTPPPVAAKAIVERDRQREPSGLFWWLTAAGIIVLGLLAGYFFAAQTRPLVSSLPTAEVSVTEAVIPELSPVPTLELLAVAPTDTIAPTFDAPEGLGGRIVFTCTRADLMQLCMVLPTGKGGVARLTGETAHDFYPTFSPDGKAMVFASNRAGNYDLYIKVFDGDTLTQLTTGVGEVASASFSPDGKMITFSTSKDGKPSLWTVDRNADHMLMLYEAEGGNIASPVWSPNGKSIAFVMSSLQNPEAYDAYIYDTETKKIASVTQGHLSNTGGSVDWSPDGRFLLLFAGEVGKNEIYRFELISGEIVQLTTDGTNNWAPSYSPDGQWIVFNSMRATPGTANIFIMRPDGSDIRQLTNDTEADWQPRWGR